MPPNIGDTRNNRGRGINKEGQYSRLGFSMPVVSTGARRFYETRVLTVFPLFFPRRQNDSPARRTNLIAQPVRHRRRRASRVAAGALRCFFEMPGADELDKFPGRAWFRPLIQIAMLLNPTADLFNHVFKGILASDLRIQRERCETDAFQSYQVRV